MSHMTQMPVPVASWEEEEELLSRCDCGGEWRLAHEEVVPVSEHWYDALIVKCATCCALRRAIFDITSFFEVRTHAWVR